VAFRYERRSSIEHIRPAARGCSMSTTMRLHLQYEEDRPAIDERPRGDRLGDRDAGVLEIERSGNTVSSRRHDPAVVCSAPMADLPSHHGNSASVGDEVPFLRDHRL
jgi:hypothetical protein